MKVSVLVSAIIGCAALGAICGYYAGRYSTPHDSAKTQASAAVAADIDALNLVIGSVQQSIADAEDDAAQYEGGLIRAYIEARIQALRLTEAMLDHKSKALRTGAKFSFSIEVNKPDVERLEKLQREIGAAESRLADAEFQARQSGGLVGALSQMNVATHRQTIALLEQAAAAAKFGLVMPHMPIEALPIAQDAAAPAPYSTRPANRPAMRNLAKECIEHLNQEMATLERNTVYVQFAWKVELRNKCDEPLTVSLDFAFIDQQDFEVDVADGAAVIAPQGVGLIRGRTMISPTSKADRVAKSEARWRVR